VLTGKYAIDGIDLIGHRVRDRLPEGWAGPDPKTSDDTSQSGVARDRKAAIGRLVECDLQSIQPSARKVRPTTLPSLKL
jgi:hypothetical protein